LALAAIAGLFLSIGLAIIVESRDTTIKTQDDIEAIGLPLLGVLPSIDTSPTVGGYYGVQYGKRSHLKKKRKRPLRSDDKEPNRNYDFFAHDNPQSLVAESCRAIRTNLYFISADKSVKKILITSPSAQEGKTTIAINLAIVMAQSGSKVLLVDTDMRRPRIQKSFDLKPKTGISTLILSESNPNESIIKSDIPNLDVLMCGPIPPNPAELLHTESFARVIEDLSSRYDRIVFDSPPVGIVTDAAILSKHVDGTVVVVKSQKTTVDETKNALNVLNDIGSTLFGVVLNDLDMESRKS
jgi:capsular exopolysaccharide synthesis family protein